MRFRKILGLNGAWLPDSFFFPKPTPARKHESESRWIPKNKPNKQRTLIGGGYMVVVYGSGGGSGGSIWIWIGTGIWTRIGGGIWIRIRSGGG